MRAVLRFAVSHPIAAAIPTLHSNMTAHHPKTAM